MRRFRTGLAGLALAAAITGGATLTAGAAPPEDTDRPDWVEHFPYQNGLLVSCWDTKHSDNNESQHPGEGEILPIDSHPQPNYKLDGAP
jgi:hypothetical protein